MIHVHRDKRRKGVAERTMRLITEWADFHGLVLGHPVAGGVRTAAHQGHAAQVLARASRVPPQPRSQARRRDRRTLLPDAENGTPMTDFPPPPNIHGNYHGACVACMTGTDTGLAFIGNAEFAAAGLIALGIPQDQVPLILAAAIGSTDGRLPEGDLPVVVRACASCARTSELEVGLWPDIPLYMKKPQT